MSEDINLKHNLFGYNRIEQEYDEIVALKGDLVMELHKGMTVKLVGDSRGYVPGNFKPGEEVTIVGFTLPYSNGETDHIIEVSNGSHKGWVKPSNIQRREYSSEIRVKMDAVLWKMQQRASAASGELFEVVYKSLSDDDRWNIPTQGLLEYSNFMVTRALSNLDEFGYILMQTIAKQYERSPTGERFILDPVRFDKGTTAILYLDKEGELVSVSNPITIRTTTEPSEIELDGYDYYIVLTGPSAGKKLYSHTGGLTTPVYKPKPVAPAPKPKSSAGIKIFISYARKDEKFKDALAEHLSGLRNNKIIEDWTDKELLAGDVWNDAICQVLEESKIILFLVSSTFMNSNYINEVEIKRALERNKEGDAIIIPIIIRPCDFKSLPLQKFAALPKNLKPISDWTSRDKAWLDVVDGLKKVIATL
ncbi:TIR domain-containing protein [Chryseolinea serpens]|uniref:TIR domain-containing protein n=1 Tax=Chryseolinea serpens TaxID=947013 RepID=A0A1M5RRA3_9BACT|nr:toll/interleukin-1 receptor domain-containing protein [Chryseolinea serpens]SHH28766.1 TIR domain-containing protein [Chryseolinea serpens]